MMWRSTRTDAGYATRLTLLPSERRRHINSGMPSVCSRRGLVFVLVACAAFAGCESYPPAEQVTACAAARFGAKTGGFSVERGSASAFSGAEHAITYQKYGSTDYAIVIYNRTNGPVTTYQDISYGNHAEITGAVDAIRYCALSVGDQGTLPIAMPAQTTRSKM
jgi:hypothetical protein